MSPLFGWQANAAAQDCGILSGLESRSTSTEMFGAWQANAAAQAGKSADPTRQLIMQQQQQQQLVLAQQLQARYDQQLALHGLHSPSNNLMNVIINNDTGKYCRPTILETDADSLRVCAPTGVLDTWRFGGLSACTSQASASPMPHSLQPQHWQTMQNEQQGWGQEEPGQWPHQQAPPQHSQQQQPTAQNALQEAAFNAQMGAQQNQQHGQHAFGQQRPTFPGGAGTWGQEQQSGGEAAAVPTQRQVYHSPQPAVPGVPPWAQGTQPPGALSRLQPPGQRHFWQQPSQPSQPTANMPVRTDIIEQVT